MSNFERAYNNLIKQEGSYNIDPDDHGGETYNGIARVYHPNWDGWVIIDKYKNQIKAKTTQQFVSALRVLLDTNDQLEDLVKKFYKNTYWDKFNGDHLPFIIAEELLEQSVNLGTWKTAGINLQQALNILNRNGKLFKDLKVDGLVGNKTLTAVSKVHLTRLLKVLNGLQFMRYYELMTSNPLNEKFVGWLDRT